MTVLFIIVCFRDKKKIVFFKKPIKCHIWYLIIFALILNCIVVIVRYERITISPVSYSFALFNEEKKKSLTSARAHKINHIPVNRMNFINRFQNCEEIRQVFTRILRMVEFFSHELKICYFFSHFLLKSRLFSNKKHSPNDRQNGFVW